MKYVDLVIANNNDNTDRFYTYRCEDDRIQVGQKVTVPFARGERPKQAYVFSVKETPPEGEMKLKDVIAIDEEISLNGEMIASCEWMRRRYGCRYIEAVTCFTPAGSVSKRGKKRVPYAGVEGEAQTDRTLTAEQEEAVLRFSSAIAEGRHRIFLLHGITGSGKTEVYMRTIAEVLARGRTAIMLVPEIALTKQIIDRFIGRFGADQIAVLHSKLSLGERYDEWVRIRSGEVRIVIGARSAVFAPLENIGAVILDEEHEATYKSDKSPKYDTVEVAIKRVKTQREHGIIVLGSATPSVSSYYRAERGIYEKVQMTKRYNHGPLPTVRVADMRMELSEGNRSIFSRLLYDEMKECLEADRQIILFLNRRGYSTFISCRECGFVMKCPDCDIALTYHKAENRMRCHYCGHQEKVPALCPSCESRYIRFFGAGTEKVEEETASRFPEQAIGRLDLDTIRRKGELDKTLNDFARGRTRILIGTQLVAKGLDFARVGLVGVVSADTSLNIPDFRSAERTFQLLTQAGGRAGRGDFAGSVVIQTYSPAHYAVTTAAGHDYEAFYGEEIKMRRMMSYPPFSDLIQITVAAEEEETALRGAKRLEWQLRQRLPAEDAAFIFPVQELFFFKQEGVRYRVLIKSPAGRRGIYLAELIKIKREAAIERKNGYSIGIDINPYSFI